MPLKKLYTLFSRLFLTKHIANTFFHVVKCSAVFKWFIHCVNKKSQGLFDLQNKPNFFWLSSFGEWVGEGMNSF